MLLKEIPVLKAKRFGVYTCHENSSLREAAKLLDQRNISSLVVVGDEGELCGIITRFDLVRACYNSASLKGLSVKEYMNPNVVTIGLDGTLQQVMELLIEGHIHRVVAVREQDGKVIPMGILSDADLVYHMAQNEDG